MAIIKFQRLIEDLENNTAQVISSMTKKASTSAAAGTSAVATTAVVAGSAAYGGTAAVAAKGTSGSAL